MDVYNHSLKYPKDCQSQTSNQEEIGQCLTFVSLWTYPFQKVLQRVNKKFNAESIAESISQFVATQ